MYRPVGRRPDAFSIDFALLNRNPLVNNLQQNYKKKKTVNTWSWSRMRRRVEEPYGLSSPSGSAGHGGKSSAMSRFTDKFLSARWAAAAAALAVATD